MSEKNNLVDQAAAFISQQGELRNPLPLITSIIVADQSDHAETLVEGRWIKSPFKGSIRIDPANYGAGKTHAHVYGRKGNEIGVVNFDGTSSHGVKCRLPDYAAEALRKKGFSIRASNIVEWIALVEQPDLLFG